ncbi:MAG TPA: IS30 family transposase [Candidatus Yonathbacteria bacterium]|nr:IS30 family transposase [Candidatus Yonathbacteria bacterium]
MKKLKNNKSKEDKERKTNKRGHMTKEERFLIEKMLKAGNVQKKIASTLERGRSTVCEEIKRNTVDGEYTAQKAQRKSYMSQYNKKKDCFKVSMDTELYNHVVERLENKISPEEISSETGNKKNTLPYASAKAIRKFISKRRPDLEVNLFWNRNKTKSGKKRAKGKYLQDPDRKWVEKRYDDFNLFDLEYGHWEGDFIVSKHNSFVLLVLVERSAKYVMIDILPNRKNTLVNERISSMLKNYKVKSLTLDNDIAFQNWKGLEKLLNCNIYFTHPYHSWEKGLVENMNRWIREFVPKKSDISKIEMKKVVDIQNWLNNKPRVILDGYSSYELMMFEEKNYVVSSILLEFPNVLNSYLVVG